MYFLREESLFCRVLRLAGRDNVSNRYSSPYIMTIARQRQEYDVSTKEYSQHKKD